MLGHEFAWSKMIKNALKFVKTYFTYEYYVLDNLKAFFIIFDHAKACVSMCFLVKIHNIMFYAFWLAQKG